MVSVGDLCWDIVTETLWIVSDIWWCAVGEDYKYDLINTRDLMVITTNDIVVTNMRADFLKRTKNVLDKSEE